MVESPLQAGDAQKGLRTSRGLLSEWLQSLDGTLVVPIAKLKPLGGFEYIGERSGGRRVGNEQERSTGSGGYGLMLKNDEGAIHREPGFWISRRRQCVQFAQVEVPVAKQAAELRHGQVGDLFKAVAGALHREVAVLFHQTPSEPDLPDRKADDDSQKQRQASAHGERT